MCDLAEDWLKSAPKTGYLEIDISGKDLTFSICEESRDLLAYLKANGIEYGEKTLVLCG